MKSILKKYYIAFLLTLVMFLPVQTISAQTNTVYPVELNAFLTPPYTPCFMEYTEAGRFQLNIIRKDLYHKNWKFYVKMTVASFGGSSIVAYSDEISLGQGLHTPFLDFRQFIKNCPTLANCLKEGNYNLVFEAVDRSTGSDVSLSRPFTVSAYMERGKAPYLFAPYDEQNFPVGTAVTNFSWQLPKMTAEFLQYKLEVIDITDKGISANAAFESMLPQTPDGLCEYTTATSFVWNKALIDGHTYAWRVSAVNADKSPKTGFENNGISKVFSFTCGKKVDPFEEMMEKESEKILTSKKVDDDLDVLKMDKVEMSFKDIMAFWVKDNDEIRKKYSGVSIEIQPLGKDKWTPYSILYSESGDETLSLPVLVDKDLTHVARGQYFILDEDGERIYAPYSDTIHFVIPGEPSEDPDCGSPLPELSDCNGKDLPEKQDIQEIYCHGTKIDVESISSYSKNNDYIVLSGNGFLSFKFAKIFKLKVKFDNIKINCAKELMQGSVITVYDEKNALKLDLNEIFGGKNVDGDQKTEQVESPTIKTTPSDTPGDFWKDGSDIKMRGTDGSVITVGSVTSVSSLSYDNSEIKSDNQNGTVRFTDATTPFDDDKLGLKDVLAGYYIPFDEGRLYYIPYVAVTHGNVSKVTVSVSDKCKDVKYIVKLSQDEVLELNVENGKVLVPGNNTTKSSQVYAISKNSEGKYVNVGSLLVSNFAVESKTLHIVPLTDETVSDASALQAYINNIYAGLGYEFKVSVENKLVDEWITENVLKDGGLKIAADDQSAWTSMTDEMKKVCSIYKEHNEDNVKDGDLYLFLVPNAEESKYKGTAGDLPRSQSVGFIFTDNAKPGTAEFNHTVAHELGHAFNLQHLFEHSKKIKQGSTSNLMDYNTVTSNDLLHFQWHNIHNERIWVWPVLEKDEFGMSLLTCILKDLAGDAMLNVYDMVLESLTKDPNEFNENTLRNELYKAFFKANDDNDIEKQFYEQLSSVSEMGTEFLECLVKEGTGVQQTIDLLNALSKLANAMGNCKSLATNGNQLDNNKVREQYCDCLDAVAQPIIDFVLKQIFGDNADKVATFTEKVTKLTGTKRNNAKANIKKFNETYKSDGVVNTIMFLPINLMAKILDSGLIPEVEVKYKISDICKSLVLMEKPLINVTVSKVGNDVIFNIRTSVPYDSERGCDKITLEFDALSNLAPITFEGDQIPKRNTEKSSLYEVPYVDHYFLGVSKLDVIKDLLNSNRYSSHVKSTKGDVFYYQIKVSCDKLYKDGVNHMVTCTATINNDGEGNPISDKIVYSCATNLPEIKEEQVVAVTYTAKDECSRSDLFTASSSISQANAVSLANKLRIERGECPYGLPKCSQWEKKSDVKYSINSTNSCNNVVNGLYTVTLRSKDNIREVGSRTFNEEVAKNHLFEVFTYSEECYQKDSIIVEINGRPRLIALDEFLADFALEAYMKFIIDFEEQVLVKGGTNVSLFDNHLNNTFATNLEKLNDYWQSYKSTGHVLKSQRVLNNTYVNEFNFLGSIFNSYDQYVFKECFNAKIVNVKLFRNCDDIFGDLKKILKVASECLAEMPYPVTNEYINYQNVKKYLFKGITEDKLYMVSNYLSYSAAYVQREIKVDIGAFDNVFYASSFFHYSEMSMYKNNKFYFVKSLLNLK